MNAVDRDCISGWGAVVHVMCVETRSIRVKRKGTFQYWCLRKHKRGLTNIFVSCTINTEQKIK
jgi:hypothetical protein